MFFFLFSTVAVVVAFFICWAPFHTQRLLAVYVDDKNLPQTYKIFNDILFYTSGILYYVASTVNPILYNLMSKKYREAFKETLCRCCYTRSSDSAMIGDRRSVTYSTCAISRHGAPNHVVRNPEAENLVNQNEKCRKPWAVWKYKLKKGNPNNKMYLMPVNTGLNGSFSGISGASSRSISRSNSGKFDTEDNV